MLNFKVGDRVKIEKNKYVADIYLGKIGVITKIYDPKWNFPYDVMLDGNNNSLSFNCEALSLYKVEPLPLPG